MHFRPRQNDIPQGIVEHFDIRDGLPDMKVESLHFDASGTLWLGTHSRGLSSFDGEQFRTYGEHDGIGGKSVNLLCTGPDGVLWIGTDAGVWAYTGGRFESHSTLGRGCLWGAAIDGQDRIWFGLDRAPGLGPAVAVWDGSDLRVHTDISDEAPDRGASINDIAVWRDGVWLAGDGLYVWRNGQYDCVSYNHEELRHIVAISPVDDHRLLVGSAYGAYVFHADGRLQAVEGLPVIESATRLPGVGLIATTRAGGVFRFDNDEVVQICDLSVPLWRSLAVDNNSRLWLGSYGFGLYRYDPNRLRVYSEIAGVAKPPIRTVEATGTLTVGMSTGICQQQPTGRFAPLSSWADAGHESLDVTALIRGHDGRLWVGKRNGIVYVEDGDGFRRCAVDERLTGYSIDGMAVDTDGRVWVASSVGSGFAVFDGVDALTYIDPSAAHSCPPRISAICTGPGGSVFVGSGHPNIWDGIAELSADGFRRAPGIAGVAVSAMCVGHDGRLWVGSNEGLSVLDQDFVVSYGMEDGLPTDLITALFCDSDGRIWIGTEGAGLVVHDGDAFVAFTVTGDPFCNTVNAIAEGPSGVWVATNGGLLERRLASGWVRCEAVSVTADRDYSGEEEVQIPDSVSRITIHIRGRSELDASRDLVYRYRLIGFDKAWRQTSDDRLEYPSLRPGEYRLEAQAIDRDLNYSEVAVLPITVVADPRLDAYREALSAEGAQGDFIGESDRMLEVLRQIREVSWTDLTVLILGETGTGKGIAAKRIHECSERHAGPFVYVNCGSLQEGLVDSELFGHEKGAFTGAFAKKLGKFELAEGGTIFLDEIGDLPLDSQARLLKVLQDKTIERVGGTRTIDVDVRVVAATNRDLSQAIQEKRYRADLFYRLNVFPIVIPPLRERREDTASLARHFVSTFSAHLNRPTPRISGSAMATMVEYDWPGNVRELEHILQRAVILSSGEEITVDQLMIDPGIGAEEPYLSRGDFVTMEEHERRYISRVLEHTGGVIHGPKGAAAILGVKPTTLRSRLERLGMDYKKKATQRDATK